MTTFSPTAPAPNTATEARLDSGRPERRPDPGRDRATDQRRLLVGQVDPDRHRGVGGNDQVVGKAAGVEHRADRLAVTAGARLRQTGDVLADAARLPCSGDTGCTAPSSTAAPSAGREAVDALPHALHLGGALVPEQDRREARVSDLRQVGMAQARCARAQPHLARPGRIDLERVW